MKRRSFLSTISAAPLLGVLAGDNKIKVGDHVESLVWKERGEVVHVTKYAHDGDIQPDNQYFVRRPPRYPNGFDAKYARMGIKNKLWVLPEPIKRMALRGEIGCILADENGDYTTHYLTDSKNPKINTKRQRISQVIDEGDGWKHFVLKEKNMVKRS